MELKRYNEKCLLLLLSYCIHIFIMKQEHPETEAPYIVPDSIESVSSSESTKLSENSLLKTPISDVCNVFL